MLTETKTYFDRSGSGIIQTTVTNPALKVVSISNEMVPGDVVITEIQYDALQVAVQLAIDTAHADLETYKASHDSDQATAYAAASAKLLVLGLTQSEIDGIFNIWQ